LTKLRGHAGEVTAVVFSVNDAYLATIGDDSKIIVWDLSNSTIKNVIKENFSNTKGLAFINNGEVLVSGVKGLNSSCSIRFWESLTGKILGSERNDCSNIKFTFSPDEAYVAISSKSIAIMKRVATSSTPQGVADANNALEFSEVVQAPNVKADELFSRAKEWVVTTLLTSNEVLQVVDKENGILIGKGSVKYDPDTFMSKATLAGTIRFIVKIQVKDQ
jgi:hypothetical protein